MQGSKETTFGIRCAIVVTLLREGHLVDWKQAERSNQKNDPAFWDRRGRKGGLEGQWLCMGVFDAADAFQTWLSEHMCKSACIRICIDL